MESGHVIFDAHWGHERAGSEYLAPPELVNNKYHRRGEVLMESRPSSSGRFRLTQHPTSNIQDRTSHGRHETSHPRPASDGDPVRTRPRGRGPGAFARRGR